MKITYAGKLASGLQYVLMLKCFCKLFVSCFSIPLSKLSSAAVVLYEAKKQCIIDVKNTLQDRRHMPVINR